MRRTRPAPLLLFALAGLVIGFLLETAVASSGGALFVPPLSLPITLVAVGGIVLGFAIPIARSTRGLRSRAVDPFRSMRVAALAKACSLCGSLLLGAAIGLVLYLLTRSTVPGGHGVLYAVLASAGSAILVAAGLVAEHLCVLPPGDDDRETEGNDD